MDQKRISLLESFSSGGKWWLPGDRNHAVYGTYTFDGLQKHEVEFKEKLDRSEGLPDLLLPKNIDVIHGLLDNGVPITCFSLSRIGTHSSSSGNYRERYQVDFVLTDIWFDTQNDVRVKKFDVRLNELPAWIELVPFNITSKADREERRLIQKITFTIEEIFEVRLADRGLTIQLQQGGDVDSSRDRVSAEYHASFRVISDNVCDLAEILRLAFELQKLLTLLCGRGVAAESICGYILDAVPASGFPEPASPREMPFNVVSLRSVTVKRPIYRRHEIFLPLGVIRQNISTVFERWFDLSEKLGRILEILTFARSTSDLLLELRFLLMTQAIESYHRIRFESTYVSDNEFDAVVDAMRRAIPTNIPAAFRKKIHDSVEFLNEFSFAKRLKKLLKSLEPATVAMITDDIGAFVESVKDTRNANTHLSSKAGAVILNGGDLLNAAARLEFMLNVLLARDLGIEEVICRERVSRAPRFHGKLQSEPSAL